MPIKAIVSGAEKDVKRIMMKGRNLFDKNNATVYSLYPATGDIIKVSSNARSIAISCEGGEIYTVSKKPGERFIVCFTTEPIASQIAYSGAVTDNKAASITVTAPSNAKFLFVYFYNVTADTEAVEAFIDSIMINTGSTPLPYEPYGYQEGWEVRDNQNRLIWGREETLTGTGSISFKGAGIPLKSVDIFGNTQQTGTPSPDNIIVPDFCGVRTGNLVHANSDKSGSFVTWQKDKSTITLNGSAGTNDSYPFSTMDLKAGTYTLSIHGLKDIGAGKTGFYLSGVDTVRVQTNRTYTITEDTTVTLRLVISMSDVSYDNEEITVMLNLGSTALPYEPYGYKLDISNGGENLCLVSQSNSIYYAALNRYSVSDNSVTVTGEALFGFICKASPNTEYAVSAYADTVGAQLRIREYSDVPTEWSTNFVKQPLNKQLTTHADDSFTTDSLTNYLLVVFYTPPTTTRINISNIMLNLGSTAKPYSPYNRTTTPAYLGEVPTVRRIKKLVFDGTENWRKRDTPENSYYCSAVASPNTTSGICTHFARRIRVADLVDGTIYFGSTAISLRLDSATSVSELKSYLAAQYTNGTPVTVWYVLAEPETAIVNEPLAKIGDYADELSSTIPIPTVKGANVLTVDTTLPPSSMSITGHIAPIST